MTEADCLLRQSDAARHLHAAGAERAFFGELLSRFISEVDDARTSAKPTKLGVGTELANFVTLSATDSTKPPEPCPRIR
jgi:hypothetical protein